MSDRPLVIATRGSRLALWQANWVRQQLQQLGTPCELLTVKTTGDKITDAPLARIGSKGLFTKEIEEALLRGEADLAVHSMKDLPTQLPDGLTIVAVPAREDPRDALLGRTLRQLAPGLRVGTSSLRRSAQLLALCPGLKIETLRGNLDTRLRKLSEGQYDAILAAVAGLRRMGWDSQITEILPVEYLCPAVGQGALAIEARRADTKVQRLCALLDHWPTRTAVTAERAVLKGLGGGCQVPIGAYAWIQDGDLHLTAVVCTPDGEQLIRRFLSGPASDPEGLGYRLAHILLEAGAGEILESVYGPR